MLTREIIAFLETIAPPALQESYDNAGLITGQGDEELTGILVTVDCTEDVIDQAIKENCNLVISHHPIVFTGLKKLNGKNYVERTVIKAIRNHICIYAIHTNLDNIHQGVNKKLCDKLGLLNTKILSPKKNLLRKLVTFSPIDQAEKVRQALFEAGGGHIGNYDQCSFNAEGYGTFRGSEDTNPFVGVKGKQHQEAEVRVETVFPAYAEKAILSALLKAHPYEEVAYDIYPLDNAHQQIGAGMVGDLPKEMDESAFLNHLKNIVAPVTSNSKPFERLRAGSQTSNYTIRHTRLTGSSVKKVAVCGGAGSFLLNEAIRAGAQVFVTADFKYHQFFDAEGKIIIADTGHYESEQFTVELLIDLLVNKFTTFAPPVKRGVGTNPVHYF